MAASPFQRVSPSPWHAETTKMDPAIRATQLADAPSVQDCGPTGCGIPEVKAEGTGAIPAVSRGPIGAAQEHRRRFPDSGLDPSRQLGRIPVCATAPALRGKVLSFDRTFRHS